MGVISTLLHSFVNYSKIRFFQNLQPPNKNLFHKKSFYFTNGWILAKTEFINKS